MILLTAVVITCLGIAVGFAVNVALGKPTRQKDTAFGIQGESYKAVDGNLDGHYGNGSCTHTTSRANTWWVVDLLHPYCIKTIRISNRILPGYDRLQQFYIYVSMEDRIPYITNMQLFPAEECLYYDQILQQSGLQTVQRTNSIKGQFVYVWKPAHSYLTLCEFEVLVQIDSRQTQCPATPGQKLVSTVVDERPMNQPTLLQCGGYCLSKSNVQATHVQINRNSGSFQCIKHSRLSTTALSKTPDRYWDYCTLNLSQD